MIISTLFGISALILSAAALSPAQWRSQSIYQVVTDRFTRADGSTTAACNLNDYCGGTWSGIINNLDYIQRMGFTAVWISPIVKNMESLTVDGNSYHGYWAQNIYDVNGHFGSAADLKALSAALHSRGMHLMVDVVTNHMGFKGCGTCVDYTVFKPFNSKSYYHPFCLIEYNDMTSIRNCWEGDNTVALPDLRTEDADVLNEWKTWVAQLVSNYSIDGIRLDSALQVDQAFLPSFESASGVYVVGEVWNQDPNYVCPFQSYVSGVMNYPNYYWITYAFGSTSGSISSLAKGINSMKSTCKDVTLLGSFIENHDNPRFPSRTSDLALAKNAIAFQLLADGVPIVYYGQEQHFSGANVPQNREALWNSGYSTSAPLYTFIAKVNKARSWAIARDANYLTYNAWPTWWDTHNIVMRKGFDGNQVVAVFTNVGAAGSSSFTLPSSGSGFTGSQSVTDLLSCTKATTDSSGNLAIKFNQGLPQVWFPTSSLANSGIC